MKQLFTKVTKWQKWSLQNRQTIHSTKCIDKLNFIQGWAF